MDRLIIEQFMKWVEILDKLPPPTQEIIAITCDERNGEVIAMTFFSSESKSLHKFKVLADRYENGLPGIRWDYDGVLPVPFSNFIGGQSPLKPEWLDVEEYYATTDTEGFNDLVEKIRQIWAFRAL